MSNRYCDDYDKDLFMKGIKKLPYTHYIKGRLYAKKGDDIYAKAYAKKMVNDFQKIIWSEIKAFGSYLNIYLDEVEELVEKYEDTITFYREIFDNSNDNGTVINIAKFDETNQKILAIDEIDQLCDEYQVIKWKIDYDLNVVLKSRLISSDRYHRRRIRAYFNAAIKINDALKPELQEYYSTVSFTVDSLINDFITYINSNKSYCYVRDVVANYLMVTQK